MALSQGITLPPPPHRNTECRNSTDSTPALDIYWLSVTFLYLLSTRGTGKGGGKPQRTVTSSAFISESTGDSVYHSHREGKQATENTHHDKIKKAIKTRHLDLHIIKGYS